MARFLVETAGGRFGFTPLPTELSSSLEDAAYNLCVEAPGGDLFHTVRCTRIDEDGRWSDVTEDLLFEVLLCDVPGIAITHHDEGWGVWSMPKAPITNPAYRAA